MLCPARVCLGALLSPHSRPASGLRLPYRSLGGGAAGRGRRRGARGVRPTAPQRGRLRGPSGCAVVALRHVSAGREQPPTGPAPGRGPSAGLGPDGQCRRGSAGRSPSHAGPDRPGRHRARSSRYLGVLVGRAARAVATRCRGGTRPGHQHHALPRAAGSSSPSSHRDGRGRRARDLGCDAGRRLQHRAHRGGGAEG